MSEKHGSCDPIAGEGDCIHPPGLQALKPRAGLNHLEHILDSVPFTPSQGVRTPSPRQPIDAHAKSQGNPFFSEDDASSPPAMYSDHCILHERSWATSVVSQHDVSMRSLPHHSQLQQQYREAGSYGHTLHTPRSQSQASTSSGSPQNVTQQDMCGAVMAAQMQHAWQESHRPPGNEQGHILAVSGQVVYPPEDNRASSSYQIPMPYAVQGMPMDRAPILARPPQPPAHPQRPVGLPAGPSIPTGQDGRQSLAHNDITKQRTEHTSPARNQEKGIKKEGSHTQQATSAELDTSCGAYAERACMEGTVATTTEADAVQRGSSFYKVDSDAVSSLSTDSPNPDSPSQHLKSKIEVKLSSDGQLVFNARQRRTLRRALQRQRKIDLPEGQDFQLGKPMTAEEQQVVIDVVQLHIGRSLPESTDLEELVKVLLSLGVGEGHVVPVAPS